MVWLDEPPRPQWPLKHAAREEEVLVVAGRGGDLRGDAGGPSSAETRRSRAGRRLRTRRRLVARVAQVHEILECRRIVHILGAVAPPRDLDVCRHLLDEDLVDVRLLLFESFGAFGKGVGEILWDAANVLQNKLTRAQYLDEVTWTTKSWLGLQKQRISVVLHTAIAEQIVNELACGEGGRVHGAKCLAVLAGVA